MATSKVVLSFASEVDCGFYEVLVYPESEMEGNTPVEIADELAGMTHAVSWRRKQRRQVQPGDKMTIGNKSYRFTDGLLGDPLDVWIHLGIEEV